MLAYWANGSWNQKVESVPSMLSDELFVVLSAQEKLIVHKERQICK